MPDACAEVLHPASTSESVRQTFEMICRIVSKKLSKLSRAAENAAPKTVCISELALTALREGSRAALVRMIQIRRILTMAT